MRDLEERGAGGAAPAGDGDEDVAVVNTQSQFAKNAACPLTGRPVRCRRQVALVMTCAAALKPLASTFGPDFGKMRLINIPSVWECCWLMCMPCDSGVAGHCCSLREARAGMASAQPCLSYIHSCLEKQGCIPMV